MSLSTQHQDRSNPTEPPATPEPAERTRSPYLGVILLPIFFIAVFVMAYISAGHAPTPHQFPLTIAGPSVTTSDIVTQIEDRSEDAFDLTRTTDVDRAIDTVEDRSAVGAILIETTSAGTTVTSVIGSGAGRLAASTVQDVAAQIADQLGATTETLDVAPVADTDQMGAGLFYLLVLCTMGAYLSVSGAFRGLPGLRQRSKLLIAVVASVLTPIVSFSALSFSLGGFGAGFGQLAALLGVAMIYTLVVSLLAVFFNELIGGAAVFAVVLFCLAGNLPGSGGSVPAAMLPPMWQWIHSLSFGGAAIEAFQAIVYFDGAGFEEAFARLMIWLVGTIVAVAVLFIVKARRAAKRDDEPREHDVDSLPEDEMAAAVAAIA